jgi:hypothetical protein
VSVTAVPVADSALPTIDPLAVSPIVLPLTSRSVPTLDRLNAPSMVIAPVVADPICSTSAVIADTVPPPARLDSGSGAPAVRGASATVPPAATSRPPVPNDSVSDASDTVGTAPVAVTTPPTVSAAAFDSANDPAAV